MELIAATPPSRITQAEGALRWAMSIGALVTVAGIAVVMGVFNRLVDEDDLGAAQLSGVLLVAATGFGFCVAVSVPCPGQTPAAAR